MENQNFITGRDKLEFREIVLSHIKKILEISSSELRDKTINKTHGMYTETIEHEDTRCSYIQAIENLAYILFPYFDKQIMGVYEESIKIMNAFRCELKVIFKEDMEKALKLLGKEEYKDIDDSFFWNKRLQSAKKLFVELNLLLKRVDYLKGIVYGEDIEDASVDIDVSET